MTKVFYALENNTVPDVSYSSFTYSPDGHVALSATAGSFQSAARQIVAFRQSGIATDVQAMGFQATYDDATGKVKSVNFQISLVLAPTLTNVAAGIAANTAP